MSNILVFGSISLDTVWELTRLPHAHEKMDSTSVHTVVGGSGANTASWLAKNGNEVTLLTAVGDDLESDWVVDELKEQGMSVNHIRRVLNSGINLALCVVNGTEKRIMRGKNFDLNSIVWSREEIEFIVNSVEHVHISSIDSKMSLLVAEVAKENNKTLSIELNGRKMMGIRELADIIFMNSVELENIFNLRVEDLSLDKFIDDFFDLKSALVITNGSKNVLYIDKNLKVEEIVKPWDYLVDRTGAGDSFDAGFISSWLNKNSISDALKSGNKNSRECVKKFGGQSSSREYRTIS